MRKLVLPVSEQIARRCLAQSAQASLHHDPHQRSVAAHARARSASHLPTENCDQTINSPSCFLQVTTNPLAITPLIAPRALCVSHLPQHYIQIATLRYLQLRTWWVNFQER